MMKFYDIKAAFTSFNFAYERLINFQKFSQLSLCYPPPIHACCASDQSLGDINVNVWSCPFSFYFQTANIYSNIEYTKMEYGTITLISFLKYFIKNKAYMMQIYQNEKQIIIFSHFFCYLFGNQKIKADSLVETRILMSFSPRKYRTLKDVRYIPLFLQDNQVSIILSKASILAMRLLILSKLGLLIP